MLVRIGKMIKTFPASLDKLYDMLQFIREQAVAANFNEHIIPKIELAVEEALVNIITYGYPNRRGTIEIQITTPNLLGIKITIIDKGIPYNPLTNTKTFEQAPNFEGKTIGGYGIYFILKIMDEVDYKRENNCNILTLKKFFN